MNLATRTCNHAKFINARPDLIPKTCFPAAGCPKMHLSSIHSSFAHARSLFFYPPLHRYHTIQHATITPAHFEVFSLIQSHIMRCNKNKKSSFLLSIFIEKNSNSHTLVQLINGISTYVDILGEQLIRHLIIFQYVVVSTGASKR